MKQMIFNVVLAAVVVAMGGWLAAPLVSETPVEIAETAAELDVQQQLQLLSHKVVVLGARQSETLALRRELENLRERVHRLQQLLVQERNEQQEENRKTVGDSGPAKDVRVQPVTIGPGSARRAIGQAEGRATGQQGTTHGERYAS